MDRLNKVVGHISPGHGYSSRQIKLFSVPNEETQKSGMIIDNVRIHAVTKLQDVLGQKQPQYENTLIRTKLGKLPTRVYAKVIREDESIMLDIVRNESTTPESRKGISFERAGPRAKIIWKTGTVRAAIVTCGGLCPGLNDVVLELVNCLYYNYGVDTIYGIRNGYRGFYQADCLPYANLTPAFVRGWDSLGGTALGSSRGGFDLDKIIGACQTHGINQVFIIGGDGTHRGAAVIADEAVRLKLKIAIACVPKTIDNDVGVIDQSFGFGTAVQEARKAIRSAVVEASCTPNGIGIVKLMGRHAGFIAAHATLASRRVDACLVPEVHFPMRGRQGLLPYIKSVLKNQGHCVVVVAEGAGARHCEDQAATDPSGNKVLPAISTYLKEHIKKYLKEQNVSFSIKYHDPSYMIRSVEANASDSVMCMILAQSAVHGTMAGMTSFTVGMVNNRTVYLPIKDVTSTSPSSMNPKGRTWARVLSSTQQPNWKLNA